LGLFRRKPLHERLAKQGDLFSAAPEPVDTQPRWGEVGIHGLQRPRQWDAVVMASAPALHGDETTFVVLSDGSVVLDDDLPEPAIEPLAQELDQVLDPPYRVEAVRRHGDVWAGAAKRIDVVELPGATGKELTLTMQDGTKAFYVDGQPEFGTIPELERFASERYDSYAAVANRIDGDLWDVRVNPL
jgi:hypothetical protein